MKWLNSLDELLFEVVSWLAFFPLTLWRAAWRPLSTMRYAEAQLTLPPAERFTDALSPPMTLVLAMLAADGLAMALGEGDSIVANRHGLAALVKDDASALVLRVLVFAVFPLAAAANFVRGSGAEFARQTLKRPFYAQCYPTSVFVLALSTGAALAQTETPVLRIAGGVLVTAGLVYYAVTQSRWFAWRLGYKPLRALASAVAVLLEGFVVLLAIGFLLR